MTIINQQQHKLPQVYLKKFGYRTKFLQWKVSIGTRGTKKIEQIPIKTFTTALNHFDIASKQDKVVKAFEDQFNQSVERNYNKIIKEIDDNKIITPPIKEYLSQAMPNFIVRSDKIREEVNEILNSEKRNDFIKLLVFSARHTPGVILDDPNEMYDNYKEMDNESLVNRILMLLANFIFLKIWGFEYLILTPPEDRQWWTSDTPVVTYDESEERLFISKEIEFYFPLSSSLLLYVHHSKSKSTDNPLRQLESYQTHQVDEAAHDKIMKHIMDNCSNNIILAGQIDDSAFL